MGAGCHVAVQAWWVLSYLTEPLFVAATALVPRALRAAAADAQPPPLAPLLHTLLDLAAALGAAMVLGFAALRRPLVALFSPDAAGPRGAGSAVSTDPLPVRTDPLPLLCIMRDHL